MKHVVVYSQEGEFAAWPANGGIWQWGKEILLAYKVGDWQPAFQPGHHSVQSIFELTEYQSRSTDGGETWNLETHIIGRPGPLKTSTFAMKFRFQSHQHGPSEYAISGSRGRFWGEWESLPSLGKPGFMARANYIARKNRIQVFSTMAKVNRREGVPVLLEYQNHNWTLKSVIGIEPYAGAYDIMPACCALGGRKILVAVRSKMEKDSGIKIYKSTNSGKTWDWIQTVEMSMGTSSPATLTKLKDGRIVMTFGVRSGGCGVAARISEDDGETWGDRITLYDQAPDWDCGYPRTVQRPDGQMLTCYYVNRPAEERANIEATIWQP